MPKILWMSPYSLHDISSGASIHCKTVLEELVQRGFEVWSCSSFVFDAPSGASVFNNLAQVLKTSKQNIFELDEKGIHYVYTRCATYEEEKSTLNEMELYFNTCCNVMDRLKPDFVIGFGTSSASLCAFAEAQRRGIYTIYPCINGNHGDYAFPHVDFILTDSKASAQLYRTRDKICMLPTCEIFKKELFVAEKHEPKYITLVNPSFEKGLAIFAMLAKMAQKELPDVRFLVVNSRGNFSQNIRYLHAKGDTKTHPFSPQDFPNVDMTPNTRDMRGIYGVTRILVAPSLWWESWGRVATEAVMNNIPVLASTSGGLPEASGGAGIHLDAPDHLVKDHFSIPTEEEMRPWMDGLKRLLEEDWSQQLHQAQEQLSIEKAMDHLVDILTPYLNQKRNQRLHFGYSTIE